MKKIGIVVLMMAMIAALATPGFAQLRKDLAYLKGRVVYVNAARTEITVKDPTSGKDITFSAAKGIDPSIAPGSLATIIYKKGTMNATRVALAGGAKAKAAAMSAQQPVAAPAKKNSWY